MDSENEEDVIVDGNDSIDGEIDYAMDVKSREECDSEDYPHKVLSPQQVVECMEDSVKIIATLLKIPSTAARLLLNHFNWNREKLLEKFFDEDQEEIFAAAHIINPAIEFDHTRIVEVGVGQEECQICFQSFSSRSMSGLMCYHRFCNNCWSDYLTTKILQDGAAQIIECPALGCDILVDDTTIMQLVKHDAVKEKYKYFLMNNFVQINRQLRWCRSPICDRVIEVQYFDKKEVTCTCNYNMCFYCGEIWHAPVKCYLLNKWRSKCAKESATGNWMARYTKVCPKCHVAIQKDGGCNHMICKNTACRAEFCWACLGPWAPHAGRFFSCDRYHEADGRAARDAQAVLRADLQRYLFYYNWYMRHQESLKFERRLYTEIKQKIEVKHPHLNWAMMEFIEKATKMLCRCRQTLIYTYVFAYYLKKDNPGVIFESLQRDLQTATEALAFCLERELNPENFADMKRHVIDQSIYCEGRRSTIVKFVFEGYEEDWWEYID